MYDSTYNHSIRTYIRIIQKTIEKSSFIFKLQIYFKIACHLVKQDDGIMKVFKVFFTVQRRREHE